MESIEQVSEKYGIKISMLKKMQEDSKAGTMIRICNYEIDKRTYLKIVFRNGILSTEKKGLPRMDFVIQ